MLKNLVNAKKLILFLIIISVTIFVAYKNRYLLYIDPSKPTLKVGIINCYHIPDFIPRKNPSLALNVFTEILNEKYNIRVVKRGYDLLISGCLNANEIPDDPQIVKIYYTGETNGADVKQNLEDHDLVMGFDFIDAPNYIRFPFSYSRHGHQMHVDYQRKRKCNPVDKKYFACFLTKNYGYAGCNYDGTAARDRLFYKLSLYKFVASGGGHLNNLGGNIPYGPDSTENFLSQCKFTIAYENKLTYPGNVTEKPFQAWLAGSIPLYNTHPKGMEDINKNAVIYAQDYANEDEFVEYIKKVDNDDELYCKIWDESIIDNPEKNYDVLKQKVKEKLEEIIERKLKHIK